MRRKFIWFLTLFWMCLIFFFSHQTGEISNNQSGAILIKTKLITESQFNNFEDDKVNHLQWNVRKAGHLFLYFILGILLALSFMNSFKINFVYIISFILGFLYAVTDEIHQYFIPGRNPSILDVLIDSIGVFIGVMLCCVMFQKLKKYIYKL